MPKEIIKKFQKRYGKKRGKQIYYATAEKQGRDPETFHKEWTIDQDVTIILDGQEFLLEKGDRIVIEGEDGST